MTVCYDDDDDDGAVTYNHILTSLVDGVYIDCMTLFHLIPFGTPNLFIYSVSGIECVRMR